MSHHHPENDPQYIGLNVNAGIEKPESVSADSVKRFLKKSKRQIMSPEEYFDGIVQGNITVLSQAVTLIESNKPEHQKVAQEIIIKCLPYSGKSVRLGITGVPGAGKSTFIEALGKRITASGGKLAVLAIDPSSERSKGSILGDKTRMEELSSDPNAYIRPSPSAGSLGGVARKTREIIILCEAAGFETIFIETVGVGQSETVVHSMVDFFLLIQIAGAGDELQGIKRGIMEMADAIVINKADKDNYEKAQLAAAQFRSALHLFPPTGSGWIPPVLTCSALENTGVQQVWNIVNDYITLTKENDFFQNRRSDQARYWMYETINETLRNNFYQNKLIKPKLPHYEKMVLDNAISSFIAAHELLATYFKSIENE
jgi:LAO/AO transport system kinase